MKLIGAAILHLFRGDINGQLTMETPRDNSMEGDLTPEQEAELLRRIAKYEANPDQGSPWEEVKQRILWPRSRRVRVAGVRRRRTAGTGPGAGRCACLG